MAEKNDKRPGIIFDDEPRVNKWIHIDVELAKRLVFQSYLYKLPGEGKKYVRVEEVVEDVKEKQRDEDLSHEEIYDAYDKIAENYEINDTREIISLQAKAIKNPGLYIVYYSGDLLENATIPNAKEENSELKNPNVFAKEGAEYLNPYWAGDQDKDKPDLVVPKADDSGDLKALSEIDESLNQYFEKLKSISTSTDLAVPHLMVGRKYEENIKMHSIDADLDYSGDSGARHMSAREVSTLDCVPATVIVSEETGEVIVYRNGEGESGEGESYALEETREEYLEVLDIEIL